MTAPVTLTASPPKVSKSPCYFCSSINGSADRSPTAASTTARILTTVQIASSKPHTTAPTKPSKRLSMYSPPHDIAAYCWTVLVNDLQGKNLIGGGHPSLISSGSRSQRQIDMAVTPNQTLSALADRGQAFGGLACRGSRRGRRRWPWSGSLFRTCVPRSRAGAGSCRRWTAKPKSRTENVPVREE